MTAPPAIVPDDAADRERIEKSLGESLLVEASAGTGKTTEMVRRIAAMLATGRAEIQNVVAVTFTRKAAGELKLRLRQELDLARRGSPDAEQARRLERALERLEEARVGTIHSFCAELLRERPVEALVDPAFEELSDAQARRIYARAFRDWVERRLGADSPGLRRALARLSRAGSREGPAPLERLQEAGWALAERRDYPAPWRREPFDRRSRVDALAAQARWLAGRIRQAADPRDPLAEALRPAGDWIAAIDRAERGGPRDYDALEASLIQLLADLKNRMRFQKKRKGPFGEGVSREKVEQEREEFLGELERFRREAEADLAAELREEMRDLLALYEERKRRHGGLDFLDLLLRARNLIRDDAAVRADFQRRFSHIFVDEFQDTDGLQAEILILLAADDPAERDWRRVRPVPGKLFLVGDPKQSIYRFRRADVVLYQQTRQALAERGVGVVRLARSFRAVGPIQECINAAFGPEMQPDEATGQPGYVPLAPHAGPRDGQPAVVALPVPYFYGGRGVKKDKVREWLPGTVAAFVEWLVRESGWQVRDPEDPERWTAVEPRHVCLLFRHYIAYGADTTREYLHALEARGLPHVLVGQRSFHQREEVETLRTALAAVEWPDDELSIYATLRGALFGISDSVLLRYRDRMERLHPFQPAPEDLEPDLRPAADALALLAELHRERNRRPIAETLHALLAATRAHAGFAVRPAGRQVLANLHRVCDLARSYELEGGLSFRGFVEELEAQSERPRSEDAPAVEEAADGVRVMTVHTAKGLEFPVVILADAATRLARETPDQYVDSGAGLCAMPLIGCSPWDLMDHAEEETRREQAEGVRIAYVAATRARDLLVVPALGDEPLTGSWVEPLYKALYPKREKRRSARPAPGCPEFGPATVLETPPGYTGDYSFAIQPGEHEPAQGTHRVVWWDPSRLNLRVEENFGLTLEALLAEDPAGEAAREGMERYRSWRAEREKILALGSRAEVQPFPATSAGTAPPESVSIEVAMVPRAGSRPSGRRFGALVHSILRDADLEVRPERIVSLAKAHGRVLGAPGEEIEAAADAAIAALQHDLVTRARAAREIRREWPLLLRLEDGRLLEGVLDLAYRDGAGWTVVDFKSDAHLGPRRAAYERQLAWYVYALGRISGLPARGWLLGV